MSEVNERIRREIEVKNKTFGLTGQVYDKIIGEEFTNWQNLINETAIILIMANINRNFEPWD